MSVRSHVFQLLVDGGHVSAHSLGCRLAKDMSVQNHVTCLQIDEGHVSAKSSDVSHVSLVGSWCAVCVFDC